MNWYHTEAEAPLPARGSPISRVAPNVVPLAGNTVTGLSKASLEGGSPGGGVGDAHSMHRPVVRLTVSVLARVGCIRGWGGGGAAQRVNIMSALNVGGNRGGK